MSGARQWPPSLTGDTFLYVFKLALTGRTAPPHSRLRASRSAPARRRRRARASVSDEYHAEHGRFR